MQYLFYNQSNNNNNNNIIDINSIMETIEEIIIHNKMFSFITFNYFPFLI